MSDEPILVVDDDRANLKLTRILLEAARYTVRTALDADDALRQLAGLRPRLILMDMGLPGMNGFALTRQLRADPALQQVPIIALSAYAMKGDDQKALACGCAGYITKPIDTRRFASTVAAYFAGVGPSLPMDGGSIAKAHR